MVQEFTDAGPEVRDPRAIGPFRAAAREPWLLLVIAVVFTLHVCFAFQNRQVFSWDDSWYAETSLRLLDDWARDGLPGAYRAFMAAFGGIKAPLVILLPQPLLLLFGRHDFVFLLTNPLCLIVASVYLAALARLLGIRRGIPLLVLIFSAMPLTVDTSRRFFVEMPITTLTLMFIYHAIRSEQLTRRGHALAAGLVLGLGVLSKVTFPLFIIGVLPLLVYQGLRRPVAWRQALVPGLAANLGPLLAVAGAGHWPHPVRIGLACSALALLPLALRGTRWQVNLAGAMLLAIWLPLPWYLRNGAALLKFTVSASVGELSMDYGSETVFWLPAIQRYWATNLTYGFGILYVAAVGLIAVLLGIAMLGKRREVPAPAWPWRLLAAWVLPALLVFTLGRNRTTRFIMPLLPAAAVGYSLLFDRLACRVRVAAWGAGGLYGLAAVTVLAIFTFGGPTVRAGSGGRFILAGPDLTHLQPVTSPPVPVAEVVAAAQRLALPRATGPRLVMFLTDTPHVNLNTTLYEAAKTGAPLLFGLVPYIQSGETPLEALERADLLAYQEGGAGLSHFSNRGGEPILRQLKNGTLSGWRILSEPTVRLPDGGVVRFAERTGQALVTALEPCLVRYGPYALISFRLDRDAAGLRLVTCWQKQRPDCGQYVVAVHLVSGDYTYLLNADHAPVGGPETFARLAVSETLTAVKVLLPGEWCRRAEYLDVCLYDPDRRMGLPGSVVHGFELPPGQAPRIRLPASEGSIPATGPAPAK